MGLSDDLADVKNNVYGEQSAKSSVTYYLQLFVSVVLPSKRNGDIFYS